MRSLLKATCAVRRVKRQGRADLPPTWVTKAYLRIGPRSRLNRPQTWTLNEYGTIASQARRGLTSHSRRIVKTSHFTPLISEDMLWRRDLL